MFSATRFPRFLAAFVTVRFARAVSLFVAILYGGMVLANAVSLSHDPFAVLAHDDAGVEMSEGAWGHGHAHDDDGTGEAAPKGAAGDAAAPTHGHHAADHSHDKQDLAAAMTVAGGRIAHALQPRAPASPAAEPVFVFERPPRSLPIA